MRNNSTYASTLSLSTVLVASLCAGCTVDQDVTDDNALDEAMQEAGGTGSVTPMPSFASTPNIKLAASLLASPSVAAAVKTISGFQIYRCEQGATAPEWKLRTPLAGFEPSPYVQCPSLNRARLASLVGVYHYRSDFGALLATPQIETLGLAAPLVTSPVWDFTFQPAGEPLHHEVLAGRVLAQDTTSTANIPLLLIEVRGRSIDPGTPSAIASATHILRWNTRAGLAPAASTCTAATLGRDYQSPYSAEYYFITTAH